MGLNNLISVINDDDYYYLTAINDKQQFIQMYVCVCEYNWRIEILSAIKKKREKKYRQIDIA